MNTDRGSADRPAGRHGVEVPAHLRNAARCDHRGGIPHRAAAAERIRARSRLRHVARHREPRARASCSSGGYIERRVGSGSFVRPLDSQTYTFGLLIPGLGQTEIFEPICAGMAQAQHAEHVRFWGRWLAESHAREEHAREVCRQLIDQRVSGVFFAPAGAHAGDGRAQCEHHGPLRPGGHSGRAAGPRHPAVPAPEQIRRGGHRQPACRGTS